MIRPEDPSDPLDALANGGAQRVIAEALRERGVKSYQQQVREREQRYVIPQAVESEWMLDLGPDSYRRIDRKGPWQLCRAYPRSGGAGRVLLFGFDGGTSEGVLVVMTPEEAHESASEIRAAVRAKTKPVRILGVTPELSDPQERRIIAKKMERLAELVE